MVRSTIGIISAVIVICVSGQGTDFPPGEPVITGPSKILINQETILTCSSIVGSPVQNVTWLRNDKVVTGVLQTIVDMVVKSTITFTASRDVHLAVFDCAVDNGVLKNPLKRSYQVEIWFSPKPPVLSGPIVVTAGETVSWTCQSDDAYSLQTMTMRVGDEPFDNEFSTKPKFNTTRNSYDVTGTLSWVPTMQNDGQVLYCDVNHDALSTAQTTSLKIDVREAPSPPTITGGPDSISLDQDITLTCSTKGGDPEPTIKWFRNDVQLSGTNQRTNNGVTTSVITFRATKDENLKSYKCEVSNEILATPLIQKYDVKVKYTPDMPSLVGPTVLKSGDSNTWTCTSRNGSPAPTMTMRLDDKRFTNELQVQSIYDTASKGYIVTGTLTWTPSRSNDGSTIYCDVNHVTLTNPQTVGLRITVNDNSPVVQQLFGHGSVNLTWGEIVSIALLILSFILLSLLCAFLQGCCGFCCGAGASRKKQEVVEHNHLHVYNVTVVAAAARERRNYEIRKYEAVYPETSSSSSSSSTSSSDTTETPFSLSIKSNHSYTYEEEERMRQSWKKSKRQNRKKSTERNKETLDNPSGSHDITQHSASDAPSYGITQRMVLEEQIVNPSYD